MAAPFSFQVTYSFYFGCDIILYPGRIPPLNGIYKRIINQHTKMEVITAGHARISGTAYNLTFCYDLSL